MLCEGLEGIWGHLGGFRDAFGVIREVLGGSWVAFGDIWDPLGPPQGLRIEEGRPIQGGYTRPKSTRTAVTRFADWHTLTSNWTGYQTGRQATGDWIGTRTGNQ